MANSSIDLISLDFDAQKTSLINYLKTQEIFKDYDFEGSNLNVLIDLLTYNTFKNAFYLNMALSEGFIDSAQLEPSILSHAKELNYLPRSARSAKATIQLDWTATGIHQPYVIQKGQSFTAQVKNNSFIFTIPETVIVASANTSFSLTTDIYEGAFVKESYVFDTTTALPLRFRLTNQNVDIDSVVVNVFEDGNIIGVAYKRVISLLDLDDSSQVYFIQTSSVDGNYEILFGDGVLGYQPKNGSLIVIDYRVSSGDVANGTGRFSLNFDPTNPFAELTGDVTLTTLAAALGGAPREDIETTRFYAPRWFQTQERAVVPSDYVVLMKTQFPEIHAINVYGGEQVAPPQFGKVFVALSISNVIGLPQSKIDQYTQFLQARMMMTTVPVFVLPDYTYIDISTDVSYNVNVTSESSSRIQAIVLQAIGSFNETFLNNFNVTFKYSRFLNAIDNADPAIDSNLTNVLICKKLQPTLNQAVNYYLTYNMALVNDLPFVIYPHNIIQETTLRSSLFTYNEQQCYLEDDNQGNVNIVQQKTTGNITFVRSIGTINYDTGQVFINNFAPEQFEGTNFIVYVRPRSNDISCNLNTILTIDMSAVKITVEQIRS